MNCITTLILTVPFFAYAPVSSDAGLQTIHGDQISFELVTSERNQSFLAICDMYQLDENELAARVLNMRVWCVFDATHQPIGAVQVDAYHSLQDLLKQVSDPNLAQMLYTSGKFLELSYALTESNRGKGIGSKVVKTWVDHARGLGWAKHLFAVVDSDNGASIRILEKNSFSYVGEFVHAETQTPIRLYTL